MRLVGGAGCRLQLQVAGSMGGQDRGRGWHRRWAGIQGWASRTGLASGGGHPGAGIQDWAGIQGWASRGGHPGMGGYPGCWPEPGLCWNRDFTKCETHGPPVVSVAHCPEYSLPS